MHPEKESTLVDLQDYKDQGILTFNQQIFINITTIILFYTGMLQTLMSNLAQVQVNMEGSQFFSCMLCLFKFSK